MTKWDAGMPVKSYFAWINTLSEKNEEETRRLIPGVVAGQVKGEALSQTAERFFLPLWEKGLFPFQGEQLWVECGCADWEQAEQLPHRLARLCVSAAGLRGKFRGGAAVDLRWCAGEPAPGQLAPLEQFFLQMSRDVRPLILTAPGAARAVCREMAAVDLQLVQLPLPGMEQLRQALEDAGGLSCEERERVLSRARESSPEAARSVANTVRRLHAAGEGPLTEGELLAALPAPGRKMRPIGFEREG